MDFVDKRQIEIIAVRFISSFVEAQVTGCKWSKPGNPFVLTEALKIIIAEAGYFVENGRLNFWEIMIFLLTKNDIPEGENLILWLVIFLTFHLARMWITGKHNGNEKCEYLTRITTAQGIIFIVISHGSEELLYRPELIPVPNDFFHVEFPSGKMNYSEQL